MNTQINTFSVMQLVLILYFRNAMYILIILLLQFESKTFLDFIENEPNKIIKDNKNFIDDKNDLLNDEKKY